MWLTNSSVGRKLVMSISGIFLVLFLTFHMSMNLVAIISADAYNAVCGFLGSNWYAVAGTAVLVAGVLVHFVMAAVLTAQNKNARPVKYEVSSKTDVEWSSKNMFVLGLVIIGILCFHLIHFWAKMMLPELIGSEDMIKETAAIVAQSGLECKEVEATQNGAALIRFTFSQWWVCLIYLTWLCALWFHLTHGIWSALHTVGMNNKVWMSRIKCISMIFATIICLGFAAVVVFGYCSNL